MTLRLSLRAIRQSWLLVLALTLFCGTSAFAASSRMTPVYEARAEQYFTINFGNTANDLAQGSTYTSNQMISFGELATSDLVLVPVIRDLGLDATPKDLARRIAVSTPRDTVLLRITVTAAEARRAAEIANAVADQIKVTVEQVAPSMANGNSTVTVRTVNRAKVPDFQSSPNKRLALAMGLVVGFLAAGLIALARQGVDARVQSRKDLEALNVPFLGAVDDGGHERAHPRDRGSYPARDLEAYRYIRANLEASRDGESLMAFVVTSPIRIKGNAGSAEKIAVSMAEAGGKTLLCDGNMRDPALSELLGVSDVPGLSDVLEGRASVSEARRPTSMGTEGLWALGAGSRVEDAGRLLASPAFGEFVSELRVERYDTVVVSTVPVLEAADAVTVGRQVDGVVLITEAGTTRRRDVREAVELLDSAGVAVLGTALNGGRRGSRWWEFWNR